MYQSSHVSSPADTAARLVPMRYETVLRRSCFTLSAIFTGDEKALYPPET
jgi:hypothetical protein